MIQDIRYALRQSLKRPIWSASIISVLALGIGANMAMYSGFEAWVVRPLDFEDPSRLVAIYESQPQQGRWGMAVSARNLADWKAGQQTLEDIAAFDRERINVNDESHPVRLEGALISHNLFPLLGKSPFLGRGFRSEEDRPGAPSDVALISHELWSTRFESNPDVVGSSMRLDGRVHEIVGVMPEGFKFPEWAEIWVPLGMDSVGGDRGLRGLNAIGRLKPGVPLEAAQADLQAVASRLEAEYPLTNRGWSLILKPLRDDYVPDVIKVALTSSMGAALLVLLVICANVASLLLAQASLRSQETALRTALGAGRARLVRQNLIEGVLLALPAGALGMVLGILGIRSMLSYVPLDPPYLFSMTFTPGAGIFTLLVSLLAGVACGLAPVVRNSGIRAYETLRGGARTAGSASTRRLRGGLVVTELALSTALLIGALLLVKSFLVLQSSEKGFRTQDVMTAEVSLAGTGLSRWEDQFALLESIRIEVAALPSIESVGAVSILPASQGYSTMTLIPEGRLVEPGQGVLATVQGIAGAYLQTMEILVLSGRDFTAAEKAEGGDVVLVSRGLGERLWPGQDPLGRRLRSGQSDDSPWLRVVGVTVDVHPIRDMVVSGEVPEIQVYFPYRSRPDTTPALVVRTRSTPSQTAAEMRRALTRGAPGIPASEMLTLDEAVFRAQWVTAFFSRQLTTYAVLATLIAALGLYGLTADSVAVRTRELAIRMAVGARAFDLLRLVLREALTTAGIGVILGVTMALWLTEFGASMLQVRAQDPTTFVGVPLILLIVTLLASLLPARRAALLDPIRALRAE